MDSTTDRGTSAAVAAPAMATWDGADVGLGAALGRALLLRCPRCGSRKIFRRWIQMVDRCPRCGLQFEREQGYWLGAMALNLGVTEALFIVALVVSIATTWPDTPWGWVLGIVIGVNIIVPVVFHPFSRTIWVALERRMRSGRDDAGPPDRPRIPETPLR